MNYEDYIPKTDRPRRVNCLVVDGKRYWLKYAHKNYNNLPQRLFGGVVRFVLFRNKDTSVVLQKEAASLQAVRKRGVATPEVVYQSNDYIVLSDVGPSLQSLMRNSDEQGRKDLLNKALQALVALHKAGGWHGCLVLRNLTLSGTKVAMIDFENYLVTMFPLWMRQANDVLRLCFSLTEFRHSRDLITYALKSYFSGRKGAQFA